MDWKSIDEKLIKRGEILLSLDFLKDYDNELRIMNNNKIGHPFKFTERYIEFLMIAHYLFSTPYRKIEGFTIALNKLIQKLPYADYSLKYSNDPIIIAIDSSDTSVHKSVDGLKGFMEKRRNTYNMLINL